MDFQKGQIQRCHAKIDRDYLQKEKKMKVLYME